MSLRAHRKFQQKTPDLIYLIKKSGLELPIEMLEFIGKINTASIPTRYPEDLQRALKEYPRSVVENYLARAEQVIQWLQEQLNKS